jgi:NADPH-dependent ferric siderophore reductase
MNNIGTKMLYTRFYDQVLTEISAGKVSDGINLLVGMLDTVDIGPGSLAQAKRELSGHSLARMLLEDPSIADAESRPNDTSGRMGMIGNADASVEMSSTGRRLFEVTSELTIARALRQRREGFASRYTRTLQLGQKVCVLTDNHENESKISGAFDLILAPDLLDQTVEPALSNILKSAAANLRWQHRCGGVVTASSGRRLAQRLPELESALS